MKCSSKMTDVAWVPINSIKKRNPFFRSGFFHGEVGSCNLMIKIIACFTFWSGTLINHFIATMLKISIKLRRKTVIKFPRLKSISLVVRNKWPSRLMPE